MLTQCRIERRRCALLHRSVLSYNRKAAVRPRIGRLLAGRLLAGRLLRRALVAGALLTTGLVSAAWSARPSDADSVGSQAEPSHAFQLVHESYLNGNWELILRTHAGGPARNLTNSPTRNELYPQVSPDGSKICFVEETGVGRDAVRSIWMMNLDGTERTKVADHGRQPCWSPDGQTIAYLPQEFARFHIADYYTKGMSFFDIATGTTRPHPHSDKLHHLYNPCFSSNGKWIAATVHAGMGYDHANLLIEVDGPRIIDLGIKGCRPCLSPTGQHIAWGESDHTIVVADLDVEQQTPKVGPRRLEIHDRKNKIYHADWSPDGSEVSFSRGPDGKGDITQPGTHQAACEMVGVHAKDWNIYTLRLSEKSVVDLIDGADQSVVAWTSDGQSNKESDWVPSVSKRSEAKPSEAKAAAVQP